MYGESTLASIDLKQALNDGSLKVNSLNYPFSKEIKENQANSITEAKGIAGGWRLVRWTKSTTNWHSATDKLAGTDVYSTPGVEESINFE